MDAAGRIVVGEITGDLSGVTVGDLAGDVPLLVMELLVPESWDVVLAVHAALCPLGSFGVTCSDSARTKK